MKLEHFLTPYPKIISKGIKDLNVRLLEGSIDRTLFDMNHSKILYDPPARVMEIKAKTSGTELNLNSFCIAKETINKVKRQPSEWEEILANGTADKGLISKIYHSSCRAIPEKHPNQKVSIRPKQTLLQRRHTDG